MKERRKGPRFDVVLKAHYATKEDFRSALIYSISQVGVYLAMDAPFDVGYEFLIEINLPEKEGRIRGKCEVVWVNQIETEDYPRGMGVKFIDLSEKNRQILDNYLEELEKT